ncbi:hypothetical protein PQX77_015441 [Marasmius sp. AFHP31]|nr:hypothetical protein PQX77_015441 [Marasmius sp. AFHP31]
MNALDSFPNQPQLDIDLNNDSPGLYIGGSFFPVLFQKEEISHEIYIRAAPANKPNAPLRCHANVVGKISLTDRELDPHLEARIRSKHKDAVEQRNAPKTKYIDTPPDLLPPAATSRPRKKDAASMWRKPVKHSDQPRSFTPAGSSHPRQTSSNQTSAEAMALRRQVIHHLAASDPEEPTVEDVLRAVGPEECDIVTRRRITDSLAEVAEQNAAKRWVLKPSCWKEVRPYDWPKLSEVERTQMARKGRMVLSKLGITEADEIWSHFKFRSTQTTSSSQPTNGQPPPAPKRGIMSTEVKDKKSRPAKATELPPKEENRGKPPKNESRSGPTSTRPPPNQQAPPTTIPAKRAVPPTQSASPSPALPARPSPTARKPPGSGFKLKSSDSSRRSESLSQDGSPAPTAAPVRIKGEPGRNPEKSSVASSSNGRDRLDDIGAPPPKRVKTIKKEAGVDSEREYESSRDRNRDRERERDRNGEVRDSTAERRRERDREPDRERERDRGRERERERAERDRRREREKQRSERGRESDFDSDRDKERAREKNRAQRPPSATSDSKEPLNRLSSTSSPLKRKKPPMREEGEDDTDEWSTSKSSVKKRRTANDIEPPIPIANGSSSRDRPQKTNKAMRDSIPSSLPKKPADVTPPSHIVVKKEKPKEMSPLAQLPKIKKEPSPMPNPRMASSSSKASSTLKTSAKSRRKSFDYTSSEEEEEGAIRTTSSVGSSMRKLNHHIMPSPPMSTPSSSHFPNGPSRSPRPTAASSSTASAPSTTSSSVSRRREPSPLPTDHAGLRARYSSSYVSYLDTFRTAMTQKSKIESLLQSYGEGSVASVTDSDGEELLDLDRLTQVVGETKRMWDELQGIQQAYETSAKS